MIVITLYSFLQGHHELVEEVIKISSDFIKQNILEWVVGRGGWVSAWTGTTLIIIQLMSSCEVTYIL